MSKRLSNPPGQHLSEKTMNPSWFVFAFLWCLLMTASETHATSTVQTNAIYYLRRSRMTHCKVKGVFLKEEVVSSEKDRVIWKFQVTDTQPSQDAPCPDKNTTIDISVPQGQYRTYDGKVVYSESIELPKANALLEMALSQSTTTEGAKRWLINSNFTVGPPSSEK